MKKFLLLYIFLFQNILFGCAACQLMTPTAEVKLHLDTQNNNISNIHAEWIFTDTYLDTLIVQYDENRDTVLDKKELQAVKQAMLDYLLENNMLTQIKFSKDANIEGSVIDPQYKNFKVSIEKNIFAFSFDIDVEVQLQDNSLISLVFSDENGFFAFVVTELSLNSKEFHYEKNLYLFTSSIVFKSNKVTMKEEKKIEKKIPTEIEVPNATPSVQSNLLTESIAKIKSLFESIKDEKNPLTYLSLLLFAYIYGLVHALGPGHGKTLVASYFLSNTRSYMKALSVSLAIGVVHTFSAFILTLIIYFSVNTFLSQFMQDSVYLTTKISAITIISIALYLIYTKYKAYKKIDSISKFNFSETPHVATCSCSSCKVDNNSTDAALIISAGIIPCPGTITIFIFAISLGLYYAGFLAALVMSLGMSTIIFISAIISVSIRQKTSQKSEKIKKTLEYVSLGIILILGILLLLE